MASTRPRHTYQALADLELQIQLERRVRNGTREMIREARHAGASWQAIGDTLGISRQAAWERYGKGDGPNDR